MNRLVSPPVLRRVSVTALTGLAAAALVAASTGAASAASSLTIKYPVTGSTVIKSVNAHVALGPGTLKSTVNLGTGKVSATLTLPPATASFKQFGLIPVTATTAFNQVGKATGTVNLNTGAVTTKASINIQVTKLSVAGLPVPVGKSCQTASPVQVTVKSQKGFSIVNGGNLAGTYTIGKFAHCGLVTGLLNLTIPGSGNTITLTLGKGKNVG
jgi:hypothetical protein